MLGFLIRVGFWLGLVLVLIPRDGAGTPEGARAVGPVEVLGTATAILGDFMGICDRKPDVCESAGDIMHAIGVRAREGAAVALSAISNASDGPADAALETGSIGKGEARHPEPQAR